MNLRKDQSQKTLHWRWENILWNKTQWQDIKLRRSAISLNRWPSRESWRLHWACFRPGLLGPLLLSLGIYSICSASSHSPSGDSLLKKLLGLSRSAKPNTNSPLVLDGCCTQGPWALRTLEGACPPTRRTRARFYFLGLFLGSQQHFPVAPAISFLIHPLALSLLKFCLSFTGHLIPLYSLCCKVGPHWISGWLGSFFWRPIASTILLLHTSHYAIIQKEMPHFSFFLSFSSMDLVWYLCTEVDQYVFAELTFMTVQYFQSME